MNKLLCIASLWLALGGVACSEDGTAAEETDYTALLQQVSDTVAVPAHQKAADTADALLVALRALETAPDATSLQNAQTSWRTARAAFRHLDAYRFGPMPALAIDARVDVSPADPSGIEEAVRDGAPIDSAYVGRLGGKKKGYIALEYLLFKGPAGGEVLGSFAGTPRRAQLARGIGEEIAASMHELLDAWAPNNDLLRASTRTEGITQRAALDNLVGGGAFALELVVGIRLAMPLGRKSSGNPEPQQDPTLASDNGIADMVASMEGVTTLYRDPGFASLVRAKVSELDAKVNQQLDACTGKIAAIPRPYATSLVENNAVVQEAFEACKALKLTWNTDMTSALGATVKPLDTDGD